MSLSDCKVNNKSDDIELENLIKYNEKITHVMFNDNFNKKIGCIGCNYNDCPKNLPSSITHIIFNDKFNENVDYLPQNILEIKFGELFTQSIDYLPDHVKIITFGNKFNKYIDYLPNTITHIYFGNDYNHDLRRLPMELEYIKFGKSFNKQMFNISESLKTIVFGDNFNQKIDRYWWKDISRTTHITFGIAFNQNIDDLPNSITHIIFPFNECKFNKDIINIPKSLKYLHLANNFNSFILAKLSTLEYLRIGENCCSYLIFDNDDNELKELYIDTMHIYNFEIFPQKIEHLRLSNSNVINELPPNLKTIKFNNVNIFYKLPIHICEITYTGNKYLNNDIVIPIFTKYIYTQSIELFNMCKIPYNCNIIQYV